MNISFTKMQGCGNDYIYIDCRKEIPAGLFEKIPFLCDRHFGIGADGVILICHSDKADAFMRMFNADASEGKMCGNGVRCVAEWLYTHGIQKQQIQIETLAGIKLLQRVAEKQWTVDMGKANFQAESLPAVGFSNQNLIHTISVAEKKWQVVLVNMGNPHCVIQVDNTQRLDLEKIGSCFEKAPAFPEGVNTEFIQYINQTELVMRVWERGSGETLACGTGACASVAAFVERGLCPKNQDITVHLLGGELKIKVTEQTIFMTGAAQTVFEGQISILE